MTKPIFRKFSQNVVHGQWKYHQIFVVICITLRRVKVGCVTVRWGLLIPTMPGVCLTETILWDQRPWWRYALYWVLF